VCHSPTVVLHAPAPVPPVYRAEGSPSPSGTAACTRKGNELLGSNRRKLPRLLAKGGVWEQLKFTLGTYVSSYWSCMAVCIVGPGLW
jgi:hypothetical protein